MILIIGGGITGLAAAYELERRSLPYRLIEASHRLGGLIHTEHIDGFTLDAGPDSMIVQKPAGIELCSALGLDDRLMRTRTPRTAYVWARGALYPLPSPSVLGLPLDLAALGRYALLPWTARFRLAFEPLVPRRRTSLPGGEDESVAAFFARRFGRATVPLVAQPLLGGIHAGDIEQLSMRSLFPRLMEAERQPGKVLRTLARHHQPGGDGLFRALRSGMGEMVDALVSRLSRGAVMTETPAQGLMRAAPGWRIAAANHAFDARAVILAAPAPVAAGMLAPLDDAAARLCASVAYVSTVSILLGFRRRDIPHPLAGTGFVVARQASEVRITACTWVSSKWEARAPDGLALLRVFAGGAHDPAAVDLDADELIAVARRDLRTVLGITAAPVLSRVYRWRDAGAQHTVGHQARMAALALRLQGLPGLFVAGSGFGAIGIPDCVAEGRGAATRAADYVTIAG